MNDLEIEIRSEKPGDESRIREVTESAFEASEFGYNGEAILVDKLRSAAAAAVSLVAVVENRIAGHILFSPATIDWGKHQSAGLGLAPMSVLPEFQRRGIGSRLIQAGFEEIANSSYEFVIVLGHPGYYSKFDFVPASSGNVRCEFDDIPDEVFLIRWLRPQTMSDKFGVAKYHPVFSNLG